MMAAESSTTSRSLLVSKGDSNDGLPKVSPTKIESPVSKIEKRLEKFTVNPQQKPTTERYQASSNEFPAIFRIHDGEWIGDFPPTKDSPAQLTLAFHCRPGDQSTIECCSHMDPTLTSIPQLNRPKRYIAKAVLTSKAFYTAKDFIFTTRPVPIKGYPIPKQITGIEGYQKCLEERNFILVELTFNAQEVICEHLTNNVSIKDSTSTLTTRTEEFKKLFKDDLEKISITAILQKTTKDGSFLDHIRHEWNKDILEGDKYLKCFPFEERFGASYPSLQQERLLPPGLRPDFTQVKLQTAYPTFPAMATHFCFGLLAIHEYKNEALVEVRGTKGHTVKILTYDDPSLDSCRWLGVFSMNSEIRRKLRIKPNDVFSFHLHSHEERDPEMYIATVAPTSMGIREGAEILARIKPSTPPSKLEKGKTPPHAYRATQIRDDRHASAREALRKAHSIAITDVNIHSTDVTFTRQMKALASFATGKVLVQDPSKSLGKQMLVSIPGTKDIILSGKLVSSKKDINMIEGAEIFLQHHKSEDMINIISYLKACPNGFGVIWGPAGTGKTRALCEVARAKVCAAIEMCNAFPKRNADPARILMTAPSNAACNVIVKSLRDVMFGKNAVGMQEELRKHLIIVRVHSLSTEEEFVKQCANLVGKKNRKQLAPKEIQRLHEIGLLQAGSKELDRHIKPMEIGSSKSNFNLASAVPPGKKKPRPEERNDVEEVSGTRPNDLQTYWEIGAAVASKTFSEAFMHNENFILVRDSLGYLMLETAGLMSTKNKLTDLSRWQYFRRYFTLHIEGALGVDDADEYAISRDELRDYCIGNIDILVSTHTNSASEAYRTKFLAKDVYADEASLATFPEMLTVVESYPSANYILSGDPKQLHPMAIIGKKKGLVGCHQLLEFSLLGILLARHYPYVMLTTQHRAATGVMDMANKLFYQGLLKDAGDASDEHKFPLATKLIKFMNESFPATDWESLQNQTGKPYLHLDVDSKERSHRGSTSFFNVGNTAVVFNLVEMILASIPEMTFKDITIVMPYADQKNLYDLARKEAIALFPKTDLAAYEANKDKWNDLTFFTTDSYQGGSNKIVIIDMVKSSRIGFFRDPGRTCVNLTRSELGFFVVGNSRNMLAEKTGVDNWPEITYNEFQYRGRSRMDVYHPVLSRMLRHPAVMDPQVDSDEDSG